MLRSNVEMSAEGSIKNKGKAATVRQSVLAVVGMHRSGTSLTAEIVRRLGAATGEKLIPGNKFNPRGYVEDATVVQMHDALLAALERSWNTVRGTFPLPEDWLARAECDEIRDQLTKYLRSEFKRAGGKPWLVKDPRISILLPLWYQLAQTLDFEMTLIFCVRNPDAVAASIAERDGVPIDLGRLLWLEYNAAIVVNAGAHIKAVIDYDRWFIDANENLRQIERATRQSTASEQRDALIREVVSPEIRHHVSPPPALIYGRWWSLMQSWAEKQALPPALRQEATKAQDYLDAFAPWTRIVAEQDYLVGMFGARDEQYASAVDDMNRLEQERDELRAIADRNYQAYRTTDQQWAEAKEAITRLQQERDELLAAADRNYEAYRTTDQQWAQAKEAISRLEQERDELRAVSDRNHDAYRTTDRLWAEAKEAIKRLEQERDAVRVTADNNYEAYRKAGDEVAKARKIIDDLAAERDALRETGLRFIDSYTSEQRKRAELARRYSLLMKRLDHFPISVLIPNSARAGMPDGTLLGERNERNSKN